MIITSFGSNIKLTFDETFSRDVKTRLNLGINDAMILLRNAIRYKLRIRGSIPIGLGGGKRLRILHSPPGQPPYKQTDNLYNSIRKGTDKTNTEGWVGTDVPYAEVLELGGFAKPYPNKTHTQYSLVNPIIKSFFISPRPVWIPTYISLKQKIFDLIANRF